jgi:tRNA (guanine-N7-)-methyltransferase
VQGGRYLLVDPAAVAPDGVRTYRMRRRMTAQKRQSLVTNRDFLVPAETVTGRGPVDLDELFGRQAPRILDVGFGHGESTAAIAAASPEHDVLAVDVHTPGVADLLTRLAAADLGNARVMETDVVPLLDRLPAAGFVRVQVFFPDPWPKTRHHRRRLVTPAFVAKIATLLAPGGVLHVATDSATYARSAEAAMTGEARFAPTVPDLSIRPVTRFEGRARRAGRDIHDLAAVRR